MNVFITGAAGFIGGSIATGLVQAGHSVTGLVRSVEQADELKALGITPVIGWLLGRAALQYVEAFDHWIAFGLLGALGVHMIINGLRPDDGADDEDTSKHHGFWRLAVTGFATSIDAMAVGIGLAFLDVHIGVMALIIGLCTLTMVTMGIMLGRVLGGMVGKRAEIIGGLILIIIGSTILYEHLSGAMA